MKTFNNDKPLWSLTLANIDLDKSLNTLQHILSTHGIEVLDSRHLSDIHVDRGVWCLQVHWSHGAAVSDSAISIQNKLKQSLGAIDCWLQPHAMSESKPRLAVFDMDSTLIEVEVIDELAKEAGIGSQVAAITERCMRGELDFVDAFIERLALLKGLPESRLDTIAQSLPIMPGAHRLFSYLKAIGCKTALVSGGFMYFAMQVKHQLGIDVVCANELHIKDGLVTGEAVLPIVDAQRKADELVRLAKESHIALDNTLAVGDGANDLKMIAVAGRGVAFRAKPIVQEQASFAINTGYLDHLLYLMGVSDSEYEGVIARP